MIIYCGKVAELKWSENLGYTSKAILTLSEEFLLRATQYMWIPSKSSAEMGLSLDRLTFVEQ